MQFAIAFVGLAGLGALCGYLVQWPVGLLTARFYDGRWDTSYAAFSADAAAFIGAFLTPVAYLLFFSRFPFRAFVRRVPSLLGFTLVGALPGIFLGFGALFTVVPLFLAGCILAAKALVRETGIDPTPFR